MTIVKYTNYNDLDQLVINFLKTNNEWNRAVSLDIEADLKTLDDPKKIILSISVARRENGKINTQKFVVNEDTVENEASIFREFGSFCEKFRPLVFIGYGIGRFDLPVLLIKMRQLDESFKQSGKYESGYWAFRDAMTRSYFLDMINPVRFEVANFDKTTPRFISLEYAINHKRFERLPFMKTKNLVSNSTNNSTMNKWEVIHNLWKDDRASFDRYIEGDVHDTLLLAEELFNIKS